MKSASLSNAERSGSPACMAGRRAIETIATGAPSTSFIKYGDGVRIGALRDGASVSGAINPPRVPPNTHQE